MSFRPSLLCLALALTWSVAIAAENDVRPDAAPAAPAEKKSEAMPAEIKPGHSMHGEAFSEGPRQKPYLMAGMSAVHMPITTKVPEAQAYFDQGLSQLHGFWFFEAERSFRQVASLDPDCAMAYWGMAMANANNDKRAKTFIETATKKRHAASPREAAWIDALAKWYAGDDNPDRRRKYVRDLEALVQDDPSDIEAKAFLTLQVWKNGSWMTESKKQLPISSHQAVDALLDQVFERSPMHPAHHYRIHLWDDEKPARALVSASLCGQSSPGIAHMWHMPGHTYSKLHRYADAAWQQEASARVDHAHMMRDGILPDQIHNYAHNNEWLIRNLAFLGRVNDALSLAENMISLPRHPKYNTLEKRGNSASFGRARLAEVLEQYECWEAIAGDVGQRLFDASSTEPDERLKRGRLLGLAQFGLGRPAEGQQQIASLETLLVELKTARVEAADDAEKKARDQKKSEADISKAMAEAVKAKSGIVRKAERVISELKARAAIATSDLAAAKSELAKPNGAMEMRRDHFARLHSLVQDHVEAEKIAREQVKKSPGQVYPLAVLVEVLHRAGKPAEARAEFDRLRPLAAFADLDYRVFQRLESMAKEFGFPADWRGSQTQAVDSGQRPDLATLGPFRWSPTPATSWTLPGALGGQVSLDDYRGKPVIVVFYLGSGCLHCVEQIQKLAPETGNFQSAGISLVAISSEPLETLKGSLAKLSPQEAVPFALAADPEMNVFKSYRAFDDFENTPLHGVFLLDSQGLIRWHDISYEPFTDVKFLLDESKRLLEK